ncbi:hypothetical protein ACF0H5_017172 [Mactra antiquata]
MKSLYSVETLNKNKFKHFLTNSIFTIQYILLHKTVNIVFIATEYNNKKEKTWCRSEVKLYKIVTFIRSKGYMYQEQRDFNIIIILLSFLTLSYNTLFCRSMFMFYLIF